MLSRSGTTPCPAANPVTIPRPIQARGHLHVFALHAEAVEAVRAQLSVEGALRSGSNDFPGWT